MDEGVLAGEGLLAGEDGEARPVRTKAQQPKVPTGSVAALRSVLKGGPRRLTAYTIGDEGPCKT
jgi:hypothetical protein